MAVHRGAVLSAVARPSLVVAGSRGEALAVGTSIAGKFLIVAYREEDDGGFIITAFLSRTTKALARRRRLWPQ